jgi:YD repeat-containing protein
MKFFGKTLNFIVFIFFVVFFPPLSAGDSVNYFYDDAGRLVKTTKSNNTRVLFQYDEVGNLISVIKETNASQSSPPVVQSINPNRLIIGNNYNVIIAGQNLLTTSNVTSNNPNLTIRNITAVDTRILAVVSIAKTASPGQASITVTTSYGSSNITVNLHAANITPQAVSLFPANTATMSVNLIPSVPNDLNAAIINKNPDIVDTQSSLTIPSGGSANFTVNALKEGIGVITIGSSEAEIYVIERGIVASNPISVSMGSIPSNTLINASPVSVMIDTLPDGSFVFSKPVCVMIESN